MPKELKVMPIKHLIISIDNPLVLFDKWRKKILGVSVDVLVKSDYSWIESQWGGKRLDIIKQRAEEIIPYAENKIKLDTEMNVFRINKDRLKFHHWNLHDGSTVRFIFALERSNKDGNKE